MVNYFIGQGTTIVESFETLEGMVQFYANMAPLDRHFCKLYDCVNHRICNGCDVTKDNILWRGWR